MRRPLARGRTLAAGACLLSMAVVTGCATSKDPAANAEGTRSTKPLEFATSTTAAHEPEAAEADLVEVTCTSDAKGWWSFSAKLRNSSRVTSHYTVSVAVANRNNGALYGTASQSFAVKPGAEQPVRFAKMASSSTNPVGAVVCEDFVTVVRGS